MEYGSIIILLPYSSTTLQLTYVWVSEFVDNSITLWNENNFMLLSTNSQMYKFQNLIVITDYLQCI